MNQKIENIFFENDLKIIKSNKTFYKSKIVFDSRPMEYEMKIKIFSFNIFTEQKYHLKNNNRQK